MHVQYAANGNFEVVLMIAKVNDRFFVVLLQKISYQICIIAIRKDMQLKLSFKKSM